MHTGVWFVKLKGADRLILIIKLIFIILINILILIGISLNRREGCGHDSCG